MSIELDGILARLRRGSVPMEEKEQQRKGDVYREIKVGAVFRAERGRERSELAPGRLGWIGLKLAVCAMWRGVQLRAALGHCSIV